MCEPVAAIGVAAASVNTSAQQKHSWRSVETFVRVPEPHEGSHEYDGEDDALERAEQDVEDEKGHAAHGDGESEKTGDEEPVLGHKRLAILVEELGLELTVTQPMERGRRDEQGRCDRCRDERRREDLALQGRNPCEAVSERQDEEAREQHLNARQSNTELIEKLDQLPSEMLFLVLSWFLRAFGSGHRDDPLRRLL